MTLSAAAVLSQPGAATSRNVNTMTNKSIQIGALWSKVSKDGNPFMSGVINDTIGARQINISVFPVMEKESENSPDFRVVVYLDGKGE